MLLNVLSFTIHPSPFKLRAVYSESAVDRVRSLFRILLGRLSQLLPKRAAVVSVEPDKLLLSCIESGQASLGSLRVDERQANGNDFVRFANCTWQVASPDGFVDWL